MNRRSTIPICLLALGLLARPALAQVEVIAIDPEHHAQPTDSWVRFSVHHMFESDLDGGGDVQRDSAVAWLGHRFDVGENLKIQTQFMYNASIYDFDGTAGGLDWDDIHTATLASIGAWRVADHWTLLFGGVLKSQGEGGASFEDTLNGGGLIGFQYVASPDLQVGLVVGGVTQLENDGALLPLPLLRWRFAENWKLKLGPILVDYLGYGGEIAWQPSAKWELSTGATFTKRRFRLDESGANADGVGEDTNAPLFLRVAYHPTEQIDLSLLGTVQLAGEMRLESRTGNKIVERDYDPAPGIGLRANFRF